MAVGVREYRHPPTATCDPDGMNCFTASCKLMIFGRIDLSFRSILPLTSFRSNKWADLFDIMNQWMLIVEIQNLYRLGSTSKLDEGGFNCFYLLLIACAPAKVP